MSTVCCKIKQIIISINIPSSIGLDVYEPLFKYVVSSAISAI